jgi:tetratricopeptide (TPR) repeat protein
MKRYEDAIGAYRRLKEIGRWVPASAGRLGLVYAVAGRRAEALEELRALEEVAKERYVPPTAFATLHAGLGDMDEAYRWIDRAVQQRDCFLTLLNSPSFDELRADPRFGGLLRRVGLEPTSIPVEQTP